MRIYVCGAHSTGKTTLARQIADETGLPLLGEVARQVLAERELSLDALRSDIKTVNDYQKAVFHRQIEQEAQCENFVSDRSFCNLAYAARHSTIFSSLVDSKKAEEYFNKVRESLVFFVRPHPALLTSDGIRERNDWDEVIRIDGMIDLLLNWKVIPAIGISELSMKDRLRTAMAAIEMWTRDGEKA